MKTDPPAEPKPRRRKWRIGWWVLVFFFGWGGYQAWRAYDFRMAVEEAEAAGWHFEYNDPLEAIRADWRAAFKKATWSGGARHITLYDVADWSVYQRLLERLRPKYLQAYHCGNLSALENLTRLEEIDLRNCYGFHDLHELKRLSSLHRITLAGCRGIESLEGLRGLNRLEAIFLIGDKELNNVDGLAKLPRLRFLMITDSHHLQNLDALCHLTNLEEIDLQRCPALENVDGLKALPKLEIASFKACTAISQKALRELCAALPHTFIRFPDGSGSSAK